MTQFPINEGDRPSRLDLDRFATGELVGEERKKFEEVQNGYRQNRYDRCACWCAATGTGR